MLRRWPICLILYQLKTIKMSSGILSSLNYNLIPSSIGEKMSQAIAFPTTGNGKYYSANQDFLF